MKWIPCSERSAIAIKSVVQLDCLSVPQTELGECIRVHVTTRGWIFFQKVNCVDVSMQQTENFDRVLFFNTVQRLSFQLAKQHKLKCLMNAVI